jgi:hypothetical protein
MGLASAVVPVPNPRTLLSASMIGYPRLSIEETPPLRYPRSDLNPTRSSFTKAFGCSQAAK